MDPKEVTKGFFYIGDILVEPDLNSVVKSGRRFTLEPRVMQVLVYLSSRQGQVVDREELMDAVWGDVIVSDKAIVQAISALRKALGDNWKHPRYLQTISKNGYRLIAPVHRERDGHASDLWPLDPGRDSNARGGIAQNPRTRTSGSHLAWEQVAFLSVVLAALIVVALIWMPERSVPSVTTPINGLPATSLSGNESDGVISPDGKQLAFTWRSPDSDNYDIYVKLIDAENVVRLTDDPGKEDYPAWSPDGKFVAFTRRTDQACEIYQVPIIGGPAMHLGGCTLSPLSNLSWSPDGRWLARSDAPSLQSPRRIVLLNVESGDVRTLTHPPISSRGDRNPVFSPDGRHVAFVRVSANDLSDVFQISIESGEIDQVTFDRRQVFGLDWMPDGREILFGSNRTGRMAFWRVSAKGGAPIVFPIADQQIVYPSLSRETRSLAYTKFTDDTNVWAVDLDESGEITGDPKIILSSSLEDSYPKVSPAGDRLAFVSRRTGYAELWTADLDGSNLIQHTRFEGPQVASPSWSPDGRTLIFDVRIEGQAALYSVDARERFPDRLTEDRWDELNGSWSNDGTAIYFTSNRTGSWQIWKRPMAGGPVSQMTRHGGFKAEEAPDGAALYYSKHDTVGLWLQSVNDAEESMIIADLGISDWANWTVSHAGIFYAQQNPRNIAFYDLVGRQPQSLFEGVSEIPLAGSSSISISPDVRRLFYTQVDGFGTDLMLVREY